jgi:RNA polymerase II elongation factor ELL
VGLFTLIGCLPTPLSTKIVDSPDLAPLPSRRAGKGKRGVLKTSNFLSGVRSISSSPAVAGSTPSSAPPTSIPNSQNRGSEIQQALRVPLLHLLAIKPLTLKEIAQKTRSKREECAGVLAKIARETNTETREFKLTEKSYKELDVWKFPYPSDEDRQAAIDNAIRAFDKQRLSPDEPIWQKLLPKSERGKGKSLSRLNINSSAAPPQRTTPLMAPKALSKKKTAATKKAETKAAEPKAKEAKTTTTTKGRKADAPEKSEEIVHEPAAKAKKGVRGVKAADEPLEKKSTTRAVKSLNAKKETASPSAHQQVTSTSTPSSTSSKTTTKARNTGNSATDAPSKPIVKSSKEKMKAPNTKPKTPSPLNSSVSASDFEDDHPVHRRLSASPSPRQKPSGTKRSSARDGEELSVPKKRKVAPGQATKASAASADTSKKRDFTTARDSPLKNADGKPLKRKADASASATSANTEPVAKMRRVGVSASNPNPRLSNATTATATKRPATNHSPSSSTDSSNSEPLRLSWRQTMRLAQQFREYYARYRDLYSSLADAVEPPSDTKRAELLKMHRKLEEMKRELARQGERA